MKASRLFRSPIFWIIAIGLLALFAIDGKATTTTNWGRKSTALVRISPPA